MASFPRPFVPPILKEAAELKIDELNRSKEAFKNRYYGNPSIPAAGNNPLERVMALLEEMKKQDSHLEDDLDLSAMTRFIEQAKNDRSISELKILRFERQLLDKISVESNRLDVSSFHAELLREAIESENDSELMTVKLEKTALEDEFEMVEGELETAFESFEKHAFTAKETDADKLEQYLENLFEKDAGKKALRRIRNAMGQYGENFIDGFEELDEDDLEWCIKDIIQDSLISEDKKKTLQEYLQSPIAFRELKSTLLMKIRSARQWNWQDATKGLPITTRKDPEGKYRIVVNEGIVDTLLLRCIALGWSIKLRAVLTELIADTSVWIREQCVPVDELERREYYLFPPRPPKKKGNTRIWPYWRVIDNERFLNYKSDIFLSRLPRYEGVVPYVPSLQETQADLMKYLAAELRIREAFDGKAHMLAGNFHSFASSLPHKTILTLLKFVGVPELWIDFFTRFLAAPLNMGPVLRSTPDQVLTRKCGVPTTHGMDILFGELALFFLDFAIHKETKSYLYRLHNNWHFVGNTEQCATASRIVHEFGEHLGLAEAHSFQPSRTSIGFVNFLAGPGKPVSFVIDYNSVEAYAVKAKKQLAACASVIDWIRTWNLTVGNYASHLFGPLINAFGKDHLEAVIKAYNRIHEIIFEGSNLTNHLRRLTAERIRISLLDPPSSFEALLYLPTAYGGLGVQNPYITLNLAKPIMEDPASDMKIYLTHEKSFYDLAKSIFDSMTPEARERKLEGIFEDDKARQESVFTSRSVHEFMTFAEFTAYRGALEYPLLQEYPPYRPFHPRTTPPNMSSEYLNLLQERIEYVPHPRKVYKNVNKLAGPDMKMWNKLSGEERWVVQLYFEECVERYGGLEIWNREMAPVEVLKVVRGEEDDYEDDMSVSDITES
ncbi:hypothetical protein CC78DRAFT_483147 [Lojkania enalia]|uniref:Uncharacterized protein n=1 Tax=Lojkania enalia TaxID=147567 RepID=A0A9P4JZ10_9PLEO|nr:hypothetical protein CC78DRAFT_483147 [Didymosphaeria enalia]